MRSALLLPAALACLAAAPLTAAPPMALQPQLDELARQSADRFPAPILAKFKQGVDDVRALGLEETAKGAGDAAPAGTLHNAAGKAVEFASLWADGPVVVTFYRGGWCPYCNLQLRALQKSLASIEGAGAKLIAVAPEQPEKVAMTTENNELAFTVLSDADNRLAREFGIVFKLPEVIKPIYEEKIGLSSFNGNDKSELPLAATYVIDRGGVIRWAFLESDYKQRAEPADIVAAVKALK